uniref:uncharacterized protein n=1 Tax=Myxine glutinosa TaxID=7769 RepID=UPI00358E14EE
MVHERTHREDKPYTCFECPAVFREKASLVRHSRVHTGERPFHCGKCGRGFTEHGTLNRHLRAKGGCGIGSRIAHWDQQAIRQLGCVAGDGPVPESDGVDLKDPEEDPSAMLVEFSSVVASTQEYIVETTQQEALTDTACVQEVQMDSELLEVVHQIVSQVHPDSAHQIIVQSVSPSHSSLSALSACNSLSTNVHPSLPRSDEVATPGSDLIMPLKPREVIREAEIGGEENRAAVVALHGANLAMMTETTAEEIIVISNDCEAVERQVKESGGLTVLKTKEESGIAILAEDKASAEVYVVALCSDDENAIESHNNNEENRKQGINKHMMGAARKR